MYVSTLSTAKIVQLELMKKPTLNDYSQQKKYKEDLLVLR